MKKIQLLLVLFILLPSFFQAQSYSDCEKKTLFSMLLNHQIAGCEIKEFDSFEFYAKDAKGNKELIKKEMIEPLILHTLVLLNVPSFISRQVFISLAF